MPQEEDGGDLPSFDHMSNPELTSVYSTNRRAFREEARRAEKLSKGAMGLVASSKHQFWASVLFTKVAVSAGSIEKLLPYPKPGEHWDFSAIASLTRNLLELHLLYTWICQPDLGDDEREARFILLWLHDYGSRARLAQSRKIEEDGSTSIHDDLVARFENNSILRRYPPKKKAEALRGEKRPFIHDDVMVASGLDRETFRSYYTFLSQHTHSGPISFVRIPDHDRGSGVETRMEKIYMISALVAGRHALQLANATHLQIFPDAETRSPPVTDQQIRRNVEIEQGRLRPRSPRVRGR